MDMRMVLFLLFMTGVFTKVRYLDLQRVVSDVFKIMKEMNGRSLVMTKQSILVFFYCPKNG